MRQPAATPAAVNVASEFRRRVGDDAAVIIINDQKILSSRVLLGAAINIPLHSLKE